MEYAVRLLHLLPEIRVNGMNVCVVRVHLSYILECRIVSTSEEHTDEEELQVTESISNLYSMCLYLHQS
jgi:hypothetical protein